MASTFVRNSVVNALAGVFTTLGGFLSSVIVARLLGVQGTGVVAYATWAVTVAVMVADVGVPGSLARFLPELRSHAGAAAGGGLIRALLRPFLVSTLAIALAFLTYALWLLWADRMASWTIDSSAYASSPLFWMLIGFICLAQALGNFVTSWLKGLQQFGDLARLTLATAVVQIAVTATGAHWFGIPGAMVGAGAGALVPAILLFSIDRAGPAMARDLQRRVTRFALESWGAYLVTAFFASRMEVFFLERSWGSHAVGLFTVSLTLSNLATQGPLLLTGALLPHLSHHIGRNDQARACALYPTSIRLMTLVVFPACLGMGAIAPVLLPIMYGSAFAPAVPTATILVSAAAVVTGTSIAGVYMIAMERTRFVLCAGLGGAALSIVAGLTIVPAFGPIAAACSRAGIQLILTAVTLWYVQRYLNCRTPLSDLGRLLAAAALCAVVARLIVTYVPTTAGLVVAIIAGALTYVLAIRILRPLPPQDIERLRAATTTLPRPLRPAALAGLQFICS